MKAKSKELLSTNTESGVSIAVEASVIIKELENWVGAESVVIEYEKSKGWQAKKVSNCGYDIKSVKGNLERHIEVKSKIGNSRKFGWTELTENETRQFRNDPNYCVYLVEGDCNNPAAIIDIVELESAKLREIAVSKTIVRFPRLGGLKRNPFNRKG